MNVASKQVQLSSPTLHLTIIFTMAVFAIALVMSVYFQVEIVARGQGRVVPVSRVQVVQPEFVARIIAIHVRNGSHVEQGEALIELDITDAITQMAAITVERDRLIIEAARIAALSGVLTNEDYAENMLESVLASFHIPEYLTQNTVVGEEMALLKAEAADILSFFEQMDARIESNRRSEKVTRSNIDRVKASLNFQSKRLETSSTLLKQGTSSRSAFLDTQQQYIELEQSRNVYFRELEQKISERKVLETERRRFVSRTQSDALKRKSQIVARIATLAEEQRSSERRIKVATLRAPVAGTVDQLNVFTIGGVAEAREELMRIVPTDVEIEIEAIFSNQDIGFMSVGQVANVRLDAYPSERFGFVRGRVADLAADSIEETEGQWGYRVRISPSSFELIFGADKFPLRPGMTATVDVTTGKRRIISYFFAPILRTIENSMGER